MPNEDPKLLWQECLVDLVSEAAEVDGNTPLQWFSDKGAGEGEEDWLVLITPAILRDEKSGGETFSSWSVDLSSVIDLFQCEPEPEIRCSSVDTIVTGVFEGHSVRLVLLWRPPGDAPPIGEQRADGSVTFFEDPCEGCTGCDDPEAKKDEEAKPDPLN